MIDKLNFAKTDIGAIGDRGLSSFADTLLKQGNVFNAQAAQEQEQALNTVKTMSDIASRDRAEQREIDRINKENSTQEALVNYNNAINRASTLGTMSDNQGKSLGNEYDSLVAKVGEEKAAQIVSDKAFGYAATDAANLKASPKLSYDRISPIELPSGSAIDPLKLIAMKEQKLSALEDQQSKLDDRAFKEKEFKADQEYKNASLAEQRRSRMAAEARLNQEDTEKKEVKNATASAILNDLNTTKDGYSKNQKGEYVVNKGTGIYSLVGSNVENQNQAGVEIADRFVKDNKDLIEQRNNIAKNTFTKEQLSDPKFMQDKYFQTEGAKSNIIDDISGGKKGNYSNSDGMKIIKLQVEKDNLGSMKAKNWFRNEKESVLAENRISEIEKEISELEKNKSNSSYKKTQTFDEYMNEAKASSKSNLSKINDIDLKLDKSRNSIISDIEKKYGTEKTEEKFAEPDDVKKSVFESTYTKIKADNPNINDSNAIIIASKKAEEVASEQANTIKTKTDKGISQRKEENDLFLKQKEEKNKDIRDEQKSIRDMLKQYSDGNKYNDDSEVVIDGETYELKDAQKHLNDRLEYLDSEVEKNNEQVLELKQSIKNK